ncbi:MAG: hypothetical protein KAS64_09850 [Spirochaetes bacterium]|nr:hypothetical protein [Spirochaetota bacterium]
MNVKEKVIELIKILPENVSVDDIMEELYFKLQVDAGIKELEDGKGVDHAQVKERMGKWFTISHSAKLLEKE